MQSNRLTRIENLAALVNLEELYLSHNAIEKIEGAAASTLLTVLTLFNFTLLTSTLFWPGLFVHFFESSPVPSWHFFFLSFPGGGGGGGRVSFYPR